MPRRLSNIEWITFLNEVQPDHLSLPDWGGIANWGGTYVLMFKMPSGEWALSDISDGIPYGASIVPVQDYLATVPSYQPSWTTTFIYSIPQNVAAVALQYAAGAGSLVTQTVNVTADEIASILQKLLAGATSGLGPALWPVALIGVAVLVIMYGGKR
jgi:hypothetical protein